MSNISFEDKELEILRKAIDNATSIIGEKITQSEDVKKIIEILENFLRTHKTLCYGGTAINNILPEQDRFYNKNIEIPDYDFFTPTPIEYAKKLANLFYKAGYTEVEAKSAVHAGTYKVYVNFIPIADITYLESKLFNTLLKKSIKVNAINYCPPNFLRMALYIELSRPRGDVGRWEKVLKRLLLLNKNYPLKGKDCSKLKFQRDVDKNDSIDNRNTIYRIARNSIINQGLVFFGGYALSLYGKYMPKYDRRNIFSIPDFDVLSEDPYKSARILKEQLEYEGFKNISINKKKSIGEYIAEHYEVMIDKDIKGGNVIAYFYKTTACHSYNVININGQKIKIATIDTILSFYLIFIYANREYYDDNRLLCMSEYLFKVQLKNRLQQKGLLKRFSISCLGTQKTLEDNRAERAEIYKELKNKGYKQGSKQYEKHFMRYIPNEVNKTSKNKTVKRKK
tara:strand:+ start:2103 stop:3461 length:1359 start_codon:yes stop_codon:yes gene_type:complete